MKRPIQTTLLGLFACAICMGGALAPASAQDVDSARLEEFTAAKNLYNAKDYAAALPKFQALVAATKSPNARLFLARSLRDLGRVAEAYDEMKTTVRDSTAKAQSEAKYAQTRDAAAAELALLEPMVGHLIVALAEVPDGSKVSLNAGPLAPNQVGSPITVAPGTQKVEVTAPDGRVIRREIAVGGGETKTVAVSMRSEDQAPSASPGAAQAPRGGTLRIVGFATAGVGAASLVVFGVTGAMSNSKFSTVKEECGGTRCTDQKYGDVIDSGKTLETVATATLIAGSALLAISVPLILFGGPSQTASTATVTTVPGGGMLRWQGAF